MAANLAQARERGQHMDLALVKPFFSNCFHDQIAAAAQFGQVKFALFLAQLFVGRALRGQCIGTAVVKALMEEAVRADLALTLGVVKANPAVRLYERLGFRITHEDGRKFYMRHDSRLRKHDLSPLRDS